LDLLKKEEKFLNFLKKELHNNNSNQNALPNSSLLNRSQTQDLDNNINLFDLNYKNEITELNESLEDINFSDLDEKLSKMELHADDSINRENHKNNNSYADIKIKSFKLLNFIEETVTKVSNNIENVNVGKNENKKIIEKKKSKLQYNEPMPITRNVISIQTPQKRQVSNMTAINNNANNYFNSVANRKNVIFADEKKIIMTVSKKSNNKLNSINAKKPMTKSTKK
jgi:hypothetical protein